jgi:phage baseplate assembly protein gpV
VAETPVGLIGELSAADSVVSTRAATIFGVDIGLVTNVKDPQQLGRVKVCFPRQDGMPESDWARVVQPAAGSGRGFYWIPEIDDEVLVAYEMGQPNRPFVIRALWSKADKPMQKAYDNDNSVRMIQTKSGHQIAFYDTKGDEKIVISDKTGKRVLTFDAKAKKLLIEADEGDVELRAKKKIVLHCEDLEVKTGKGTKVDVQKTFDLKIASDAAIQSGQTATLKGSQVQLNPSSLNVASLASCNVCGGGGTAKSAGAQRSAGSAASQAASGGGAPAPRTPPPAPPPVVPTQQPAEPPVQQQQQAQTTPTTVEFQLVDENGKALANVEFKVTLPDGTEVLGKTDPEGNVRIDAGGQRGACKLELLTPNQSGRWSSPTG